MHLPASPDIPLVRPAEWGRPSRDGPEIVYCRAVARQPRLEFENALYHVIARGLERRPIFRDDDDRRWYLERLTELSRRSDVQLLAYCLMPNHIHLAVRTGRVPLSRVMSRLQTSYAVYFNKRHGRIGPVFQGRYRALLVDQDSYLLALVRYIHLNPVGARLAKRPEEFPWSSHAAYLKGPVPWLSSETILETLGSSPSSARRAFQRFVTGPGTCDYDPDSAAAGLVVGDEKFVRKSLRSGDREDLLIRGLKVETVVREAAAREGIGLEELTGPGRARRLTRLRTICALIARDLAAIPIAWTARFFRRDPSTLSRDLVRLEQSLADDSAVRETVERLKTLLAKRPPAK
jgi:putative transposase